MPADAPEQPDLMARALARALQATPVDSRDPEEKTAILMTGIMDAARRGVHDEDGLAQAAIAALDLYGDDQMDRVMRDTPL